MKKIAIKNACEVEFELKPSSVYINNELFCKFIYGIFDSDGYEYDYTIFDMVN